MAAERCRPGFAWWCGFGRMLALLGFVVGFARPAMARDDGWRQVSTPDFTLITSLTEKEAVAWAGEFSHYIAELRGAFNAKRALPPLTFVVFARERDFADYRPLGEGGKPQQVAGFFQRQPSWAVAGLAGGSMSDEVRRTIFHEGVHWFLSSLDRPNPVWIEEGLAEVFSTFSVSKKAVEWGHSLPGHVQLLRDEQVMPIERLLYVGQSELFRDTSNHTGTVYAQSWITVHFLIFGDNKEIPRTALFDFIRLNYEGMPMEAAFQKAVGSDFATFDRRLKQYLREGRYFIQSKPPMARPELRAQPAAPADVARALGRLSVAGRRWEKAMGFARESIAAAPDDPRGYELLGLAYSESGDEAGSLGPYATAVEKGSTDFQPYFSLAAAAQNAAAESGLAGAEARLAADRYEKSISLAPRFLPAFQNLAAILPRVEPNAQDREFLLLGRRLHPRDAWIRVGLAVLDEHDGQKAAALKTVNEIEADGEIPARARAYARNLSDRWTQAEVLGHLDQLAKAQNYAEALAYVEEQSAGPISAGLRTRLASMRPGLKASMRSQEIGAAIKAQRWEEARRLLSDTIASPDMPFALKQQSQRTLDDLNRRGAGRRGAKQ